MKVHPSLSTILVLLLCACRGICSDTSHGAATFETDGYPFEERKIDGNVSDPYAEDFPSNDTYLVEIPEEDPTEEDDGRNETEIETLMEKEAAHHMKPKNVQKQRNHKSTKSAKKAKTQKAPKAKKAKKKDKHRGKKETKTISPMPTMTPRPTSSPTITPYPSITPLPSLSPTVTAKPSISHSPSSFPTVSPKPTATPSLAKSDEPEETDETVKRPFDAVTEAEEQEELMNKFAISYELEANAGQPENDDYDGAAYATSQYLEKYIKTYYDDIDEVTFVGADITMWNEPSPLLVDFDAVSSFTGSPVPSSTELDGLIWNAFSSERDIYIGFLKESLNSTNPLSKTKSIKFAPYWTALATQKEKSVQEAPVESSNSDTAVFATLGALGATCLVVAGLLVVLRHRRKIAADSDDDDDDDYSRKSGNLHVKNGRIEEDTLILDDQSASGNTHKSYSISTFHGEYDELVDQSPADVMKAMNLTSALTDVDLDEDADGKGRSEEH